MYRLPLIFSLLFSFTTLAYEAGHCPVGPFGTDGDTGPYAGRCHELTRQEVCAFYLDGIEEGYITDIDPAKVQFCEIILRPQSI